MCSSAYTLCMLFSLWASCLCQTLVTLGPCVGNTNKATIDCGGRNLTSVPQQIWPNVTELDLSENHLHLFAKSLKKLRHLDHLIKLNLSGNDLPLLVNQGFYHFPSLEILDLSGCKLAAIEPGALLSFPRLQKLVVSVNDLQTPIPAVLQGHGWIEIVDQNIKLQASERTKDVLKVGGSVGRKERQSADDFMDMDTHSLFQRKLLVESLETTMNATEANDKKPTDSWKYLVAALVIAISLSVLIAIGAKCKLFHRYLSSYRHSRLSEGDGASQCGSASFDVGFSNRSNIPNLNTENVNLEDDDDGFIEDNYIQASEQKRAARETEHWQEDDEDEDIEEFSIA